MTISKKAKALTFTNFVKSIDRSNEKFKTASQDKKILMVAKDVLKLLELKRIKAEHNSFVAIDGSKADVSTIVKTDSCNIQWCQISDFLKLPDAPICHVCAIGGAMVAATLRLNDCRMPYPNDNQYFSYGSDDMGERARGVFGNELLRLMECAFESELFGYGRLSEGKSRLIGIYKNLIKNKGKRFTTQNDKHEIWPKMDPRLGIIEEYV